MTPTDIRKDGARDKPARPVPRGLGPDELARLLGDEPPPLLRGLDPTGLAAFIGRCRIQHHPEMRVLLRQGEPTQIAYLILQGGVEISFIDSDGNRVLAHLSRPREVVGEVEILSGRPCAATCAVLPGSLLAVFDARQLKQALPPETLLHNLAVIFHTRLIRDNCQHTVAMFFTSEDRIRIHLLNLTTDDQPRAHISQADLATFCGCSRQTVNRTLAQLRAAGIVDLSRGSILILDRARLEAARLAGAASAAPARVVAGGGR